jgi:hypothetical protein
MKAGITMASLLAAAGLSMVLTSERCVAAPPAAERSALAAVDAEILLAQGDEPAPPLTPERRRERIRRLREELRRLESDQPGEPGPGPGAGGGRGRGPDGDGPPGRGLGAGPGPGPDGPPGAGALPSAGGPPDQLRPGREARIRQPGRDAEPGERGPHGIGAERREEMRRRMEMMGERMQFMGRWQEAVRLPSRAVMMATHALVEIGDRSQRREATLEQLNELLSTVDAVEARTAIRFALKEIYQETGAYDNAMEQMRLVIIENAPKIADEPRPSAPRD